MSIKAMKMALEATSQFVETELTVGQRYTNSGQQLLEAIEALRAAIQQAAESEPVVDVRCEGCGYMTHHREHMGCVRAAKQHTHQASSVPMTNEQWDDVLGSAGPDMLDLAKQWADNKVHVYQVVNEAEKIVKAAVLRGITAHAKKEGA